MVLTSQNHNHSKQTQELVGEQPISTRSHAETLLQLFLWGKGYWLIATEAKKWLITLNFLTSLLANKRWDTEEVPWVLSNCKMWPTHQCQSTEDLIITYYYDKSVRDKVLSGTTLDITLNPTPYNFLLIM